MGSTRESQESSREEKQVQRPQRLGLSESVYKIIVDTAVNKSVSMKKHTVNLQTSLLRRNL